MLATHFQKRLFLNCCHQAAEKTSRGTRIDDEQLLIDEAKSPSEILTQHRCNLYAWLYSLKQIISNKA